MSRSYRTALLCTGLFTAAVSAQPLTGSGSHLPIPSVTGVSSGYVAHAITGIVPGPTPPQGFNGSWTSGVVQPGWVGTYNALGPTTGSGDVGTTNYDFTPLAAGHLPAGTSFYFGDVDNRGLNEVFLLTAYDSIGNVVTTPWLDEPGWVFGTGTGPLGAPATVDMPGWVWSGTNYKIDGTLVTSGPNPALGIEMLSNTAIWTLEVRKLDGANGFSLLAPPVPAPGVGVVALAGLGAMARRGRRCIQVQGCGTQSA
ncbi:MAG: hypothetical protein ACKVW3_15840 [Phycisphaerales bacterium]